MYWQMLNIPSPNIDMINIWKNCCPFFQCIFFFHQYVSVIFKGTSLAKLWSTIPHFLSGKYIFTHLEDCSFYVSGCMFVWHSLPLLSAWMNDMGIGEAQEIQVPSHFTCCQGHCNDWHLRDEAPAGDSIRTSCMNINVVLLGSTTLDWTEGPLTGPQLKNERRCHFIMQKHAVGLQDMLWDSACRINVYHTTTVCAISRAGLTLRLVAFWDVLVMSSVKKPHTPFWLQWQTQWKPFGLQAYLCHNKAIMLPL